MGVHLLDQRHGRGLALADQAAFADQALADAPTDGSAHRGVTQIELRGAHVCLGRHRVGARGLQCGKRVVVFLATDGLHLHQRFVAMHQGFGLLHLGLCAGQRAAIALQSRLQGSGLDGEQ